MARGLGDEEKREHGNVLGLAEAANTGFRGRFGCDLLPLKATSARKSPSEPRTGSMAAGFAPDAVRESY
ncbi:MAG: hypothetical protein IT530_14050 [Burkholderiales bacterium]|nr:hypothetical protein [Burkholderiales bacterium]